MRRELAERFEHWVRDVLDQEAPPIGLAAEFLAELEGDHAPEELDDHGRADRYAVWSALTALTQEVRLQGRAFHDLQAKLNPFTELPGAIEGVVQGYDRMAEEVDTLGKRAFSERAQRDAEIRQEVEARVTRRMLGELVDMHERLKRGLDTLKIEMPPPPRGFLGRVSGAAKALEAAHARLDAVAQGYRLSLEALEERLASYGVRELHVLGALFDPARMNAVEVVMTHDVPEGTVVEVYRPGYERHGDVFRLAHVKVARAPHPFSVAERSMS